MLIYHDLDMAAKCGAYYTTKNDLQYQDDIKTMMVAPLNAWSGINQDMIGILYVSSREKGTFSMKHVDSMASVADVMAAAIANSIELVRLKCNNPDLKQGGGYAKAL